MAVRILLVVVVLAIFYGCGPSSAPPEQGEKGRGTEPKSVTSSGSGRQETTEQRAEATTNKPQTEAKSEPLTSSGCLGEYRNFGDLNYSPVGEKIVFVSYYHYETYDSAPSTSAPVSKPGEADNEICVVNADGTGMVNLTDNSDEERFAAWSPDGTKIAFAREFNADDVDIFVMNADGSNETKLLDSAYVSGLTWSPDGQKIAFGANAKIYIMRADGSSTPRTLTSYAAFQYFTSPAWSPDGKWIASQIGAPPAWSPDGKWIASQIGAAEDIYIMQVGDTDHWRKLTEAFSPEGGEIAFNRYEPGEPGGVDPTTMIYNVYTAGSKATLLGQGRYPTWAPDGNHIAYVSQDLGGIYVMDSDGSDQTLVVRDAP